MSREDPERVHRLRWAILGVLCLSLLLVVLGNSILNVALPTLSRSLGASITDLQWIVDSYALVFGGLLLTMGALGDRFGRRGALQLGLGVVAGGALLAVASDSVNGLTVARAVMGVGAALVMPATLSIIAHVFPPEERGKAMGIWAAFAGIGGAIGPIVGGLLLEDFAWQSIFWINIPVVALALGLGLWLLPTSKDPHSTRLDPVGAVLSMLALGSLLYAIIEGPAEGWTSIPILVGFTVAAVSWPAFIFWELRSPAPMLPMHFFGNRGFSMGNVAIGFAFFVMFAFFFVMVQYLQFVRGFSALQAALRTLPLAAGLIMAAPQSDRLVRKIGTPWTVTLGLGIVASALLGLSFLELDTAYPMMAVGFLSLGLGMGFAMAPSTTLIMDSIPGHKAGVGSAMNDTSREVGGALGIAILGSILTDRFTSSMADAGFPDASIASALGDGPVATAAKSAFTDALASAYLVSAIVAFLAVIVVRWRMPRRQDFADTVLLNAHDHKPGPAAAAGSQAVRGGRRPAADELQSRVDELYAANQRRYGRSPDDPPY